MNVLGHLTKVANELDQLGFYSLADQVDVILTKFASRKVRELQEKYPHIAEEIDELVTSHPSGEKLKYLNWGIKQLLEGEPVDQIADAVYDFWKRNQLLEVKDLYQYQDLEQVAQALEAAKGPERQHAEATSNVIWKNERFLVVNPESEGASCYFGKQTKWCITGETSQMYWESYANQGIIIYFVIDKEAPFKSPLSKVAYMMYLDGKVEVRNSKDQVISEDQLQESYREEFVTIKSSIQNHYQQAAQNMSQSVSQVDQTALQTSHPPSNEESSEQEEIVETKETIEQYLMLG